MGRTRFTFSAPRDLVIVTTGDSHHAGFMSLAPIVANDTIASPTLNGSLDRYLRGDATLAPITNADIEVLPPLDLGVNALHPNSDVNVGQLPGALTMTAWLSVIMRQTRSWGHITLIDCGYGGCSSYTWSGNCATGYAGAFGIPADGDQFIVNGTPYTYRDVPAVANDIQRDAGSAPNCMRNFFHTINADGTPGAYGPGTVFNPDFFCPNARVDQFQGLTSRHVGASGNLPITGTGPLGMLVPIGGGDNVGCFPDNVVQLLAAGGLTPNILLHSIGTNDVVRIGWNCTNFTQHLTATVANFHAVWPDCLIGLHYPPKTSSVAHNNLISTIINPAVAAIIAGNPFCFLIDAFDLPDHVNGVLTLGPDGIHLSNMGYFAWASLQATASNNAAP